MNTPVIAIDGPTASGKGSVAARVASALGWHYLDSGAIYRVLALAGLQRGIALDDEASLADLAPKLEVRFDGEAIYIDGVEASLDVRRETTGNAASKIAVLPGVRTALMARLRAFRASSVMVATWGQWFSRTRR